MKKSIILLSTLAFSTVATPTVLADQLTTSASEISVQNEKEWIGISTLEFIDSVWNSSIINIDQDQVITVTGKFNFYGSNNLSPQDLMFTSNLPWISFSNVTIDNLSHTGTVQITLNTKDIEAGKNQFILRISSANNDERKNITPYSLTNVININTSSKNPAIEVPTPEVPKSEVPTPEVPTPEVPKSEVPTPEVPTPEVPKSEVPTPEVPTPEVPTPEVPTPEVPTPEVPTPEVPTPEVPIPEVPTPEVPTPEVPTPEVPTPEEDSDSKVTENLISTRNTDKLFQQATVSSNLNGVTQEKNKKILPVTGDNNNIIFEYIGFVLLGFTAILMYKKKRR